MKPYNIKYRPLTYWPGPWMDDVVRTKGSFEKWIGEGMAPESRPNWGGSPASLEAGSYLPDLEDGECEIARIELASTLGDVFSVRARAVGTVIRFRVVDEYETDYGPEAGDPATNSESLYARSLGPNVSSPEASGSSRSNTQRWWKASWPVTDGLFGRML